MKSLGINPPEKDLPEPPRRFEQIPLPLPPCEYKSEAQSSGVFEETKKLVVSGEAVQLDLFA